MSNIYQLQQFISTYRTYNEVKDKAFQIDPNWRSESWSRALRILCEEKDGVKPKLKSEHVGDKPSGAITGWMPIYVTVCQISPNLTPKKSISEDLNTQLIEVLKKLPKTWEKFDDIKSVQLAIKSNNDYLKSSVLKQYQGEL